MKKLLFLLPALLLSSLGYAQDLGVSWLEDGQGKLDCKKIHVGYKNARIVLPNGDKKTFPVTLIHSYSRKGRVYARLPFYSNGEPTGLMVFMEQVKSFGELGLYRFEGIDSGQSKHTGKKVHYFLYKGNKLNLAFDEKILPDMDFEFDFASNIYH
jgi:hypothetical protein